MFCEALKRMRRIGILATLCILAWIAYRYFIVAGVIHANTTYVLKVESSTFDGPTNMQLVEIILNLTQNNATNYDNETVDIIYRDKEITHYSRIFTETDRMEVPLKFCSQIGSRDKYKESKLFRQLQECYKAIEYPSSRMKIASRNLRLIRDAFRRDALPIVMIYGSIIGSTRYHTRTPYDSDYDLAVPESHWDRMEQIIMKLASNPANSMRLLNMRKVTGNTQVGIACEGNDSWRDPATWKHFNNSITISKGIPIANNWEAYPKMMETCAFYVDMYRMPDSHPFFMNPSNGRIFYRPIEGTIFRTFVNYKDYLENHYGVSMDMCVPKPSYLLAGRLRNIPSYCSDLNVPCVWLDFMYPLIYSFTLPDSPYKYEVGFESHPNATCKIKSVYYYRKDW